MSNRIDQGAKQIHGMNPQFLLETILRNKIYNTLYWKQQCFALTSETIIDKAVELKYIGGSYGGSKHPTEFICLILKMLQIQPGEDIIAEYLSDDCADYKYLRALAAFYVRLTEQSAKVYQKLEPLYNDYRKLRMRNSDGTYSISHMDCFIESLLNSESLFEITLPSLTKRKIHEANGELDPRVSLLEADLDLDLEGLINQESKGNRKAQNNDDRESNINGDYLDDLNLDKVDKYNDSDSDSNSDSGSENNKYIKHNLQEEKDKFDYKEKMNKKRKVEIDTNDNHNVNKTESIDEKLKKLDPNSAEYWLEMRKKIGL